MVIRIFACGSILDLKQVVDASCMAIPRVMAKWASIVRPRSSTDFIREGVTVTVDQTPLLDKWDHGITLVVLPPA